VHNCSERQCLLLDLHCPLLNCSGLIYSALCHDVTQRCCCIFTYLGFATIPSGGGGTLFGGFLVKQLNLQCKGILRLCLVTTGTVLLLTLTLLARCENVPFAGINVDYVLPNR